MKIWKWICAKLQKQLLAETHLKLDPWVLRLELGDLIIKVIREQVHMFYIMSNC